MTIDIPVISKQLSRINTIKLLEEFDTNGLSGISWYFPPPDSLSRIIDTAPFVSKGIVLPKTILDKVTKSQTGFVFFARNDNDATQYTLIIPPVPLPSKSVAHELLIAPFIEMLNTEYCVAVALVRLGHYAIGVTRGEKLIASKVGSGLVHGRHRQGGSSQKRFARHREKQIEAFMGRICDHTRRIMEPYVNDLDYIIYGGAWTTITELKKYCRFLADINKPELPPILDIPDPKFKVLSSVLMKIWSCQIYQWSDK